MSDNFMLMQMLRQEVGSPLDRAFQEIHPAPVHLLVPEK